MSIAQVPDEILQHLLYFVSPQDNLVNVQRVSSRFNRLANERLLWRYHCRSSFHHWNPINDLQRNLQARASGVDWKAIFLHRERRNARIAHLFDGILASRIDRLQKFEEICRMGYDAKDFLIDQRQTARTDQGNGLAVRYGICGILLPISISVAEDCSGTLALRFLTAFIKASLLMNGSRWSLLSRLLLRPFPVEFG
jgi:F-box protein 21